ncbi:endolytic transglycosylase MltG [Candidatus Peregrinibacteria bacterium]|nr:endolytic transglycosylase MltG [Candidatus Peregrinibacteria bacterium]
MLIFILLVTLTAGIFFGGKYAFQWAVNIPAGTNSATENSRHLFKIPKGESVRSIGERLENEKLIVSRHLFYWYVRLENLGEKIQAGQFIMKNNLTIREIAEILTQKSRGEVAVSIIEGWTIADIDTALTNLNLMTAGQFTLCAKTCDFSDIAFVKDTSSLEGYLFPDTYFIESDTFTPKDFIRRMLTNFQLKLTSLAESQPLPQNYTLNDRIIMASIVEKEVKTNADRPKVAGILWKRLENSWTIGADATLLYEKGDGTITAEDLEKNSPYNTRKNAGLPPTAISNPGIKSIEAAFFPEESEYWFYLTPTGTDTIIYTVSNEEQNANKEKYL